MAKKSRLRLHLEEELFELRVTPSPRRRDPEHARKVSPHKLTTRQKDIWSGIFGGSIPAEKIRMEKTSVEDLLCLCRKGGKFEANLYRCRAAVYIEVISTDKNERQ